MYISKNTCISSKVSYPPYLESHAVRTLLTISPFTYLSNYKDQQSYEKCIYIFFGKMFTDDIAIRSIPLLDSMDPAPGRGCSPPQPRCLIRRLF